MNISRRKILGFFPLLTAGFFPVDKAQVKTDTAPKVVTDHQLRDDVSVSLLDTYARSLALKDEDARWEAQMLFHEAQLARRGGGTTSHRLGYRHKHFVEAHETGNLPVKKHLWLWG